MTHEPDIPERDAQLFAAWREHSSEVPSAAMDAAILAAAHRAVKSAPRAAGRAAEATSPQRWWMPVAAAATIGAVALGILQTVPQQDSVTTPAVSDAPAPARERASVAPSAPPSTLPPSAPRDELQEAHRNQAPAAETAPIALPAPAVAPAKPVAKVTAPPAASATGNGAPTQSRTAAATEVQRAATAAPQPFPAEKKAESAESDVKDRARMTSKLAAAPEASGAVALGKTATRMDSAPGIDVDAWIARIRKLHDEGRLADAAKELVAMRAAVSDADARLPRELRAWAATVKP